MHYDHIDRHTVTDYASIAHGMPEYRALSNRELDFHIAVARREQSRITLDLFKQAGRWISRQFGRGRTTTA